MLKETFVKSCLLLASFCLLQQTASGDTMAACFDQTNKTLDIECGAGYMVHITRSFYGFSPTGQCRLVAGERSAGCTVAEHVHYSCVGQQSCSINLPTGHYGVSVPQCEQRSSYFQVEYTCVLASSVSNICESKQLTAQSGYIMTPRYPANYNKQGECSTTIVAHPSQKIRLHIIDMNLEAKTRLDCADLLYFNDKLRSITLCGERHNTSYNMHSNYLHIELQSSSGGRSKGLWLYYEATPPLDTSLPPPTNIKTETEKKATTEKDSNSIIMSTLKPSPQGKSTVPLYINSRNSSKQLPFAAIAGGVIGTLSFILIILLLLLLIKWYKERRYNKVEKVLEIRNPAFRSSSDFQEAQQQACHQYHQHHHQPNNSGYFC